MGLDVLDAINELNDGRVDFDLYGSLHATSLPWVKLLTCLKSLGVELPPGSEELETITQECLKCFPFDDLCLALENPTEVHFDQENRVHSQSGPAVDFSGWRIFAWHGVVVPEDVIMSPETITVERIVNERNTEVKRVLLERYGLARFLEDAQAMLVHEDEFGKLYHVSDGSEEPLAMVHVVDATPNASGARREYFLRVSPAARTAKEAVAWSFEMEEEGYAPNKQS